MIFPSEIIDQRDRTHSGRGR